MEAILSPQNEAIVQRNNRLINLETGLQEVTLKVNSLDSKINDILSLLNSSQKKKKRKAISQDNDNFGKCILFPQKACKSFLYPEELGILVNEEVISHDVYIRYRNTFHNSDKIQIEYSPIAKNYFIPEPIKPVVQVVEGERRGGKSFKEKYLKYKLKYLALKKSKMF